MKPTGKRFFLTGLLIVLPVLVTVYLFVSLFLFFDNILGRYISKLTEAYLGFTVPGLGLIVFIVLIFLTGVMATNFIGRRLIAYFETLWLKFPLIKYIYPALKQISQFLFSHKFSGSIQRVALTEWPRKGMYVVSFVTNQSVPYFDEKLGRREEYCNVLIPNVPNPVTGFYVIVPKKELIFLDLSIEEASRLIISGGVLNARDLLNEQVIAQE
ncbi:MAG: DUF502 domain-containing protein [Candidatus Omnitrophica bacterium]|nr:DUF502 domain-containing protein [Candidatus Omnitrophota bacterium]MDD5574196.1 DUF502 domain-containing protein [Candidatus Omnitrophota bacterium]